ncbi:MAG: MATE family efflux transporter [Alphaproteobacteria bacterium CG_4_9_14_3_um_filter_47_13]|nr:MAG: MATE family efflux transporter [Alphaproteobacteria bacterium CG_4_9_14_3_um_filter_47_13]
MNAPRINLPHANKGDLTKGSVAKQLTRLTLPMIWGIFAIISFQLVDTYYISLLGTQPLAAMTFTFPVTYLIFSLTMGLGIAMSSVVSRQIGEGNQDKVRRLTTHGLMLAFLTGSVLAVLGLCLINPLFRAMGADDIMMPMIRDYMIIWFGGNILLTVPLVGNAALRASGDSFLPAIIMTVAAVINIILDPILIFGMFGFPRMELQGAAIATVFANGCAMLTSFYILYARKKMICRDGLHLRHFMDSMKRLGYIALPVGLTGTIQPIVNAVIIGLLASYGAETIAAYGVVSRMEALAFTIIMALSSAMIPMIGQNWGAERFSRVHETINKAFIFAFGWSLFIAAIFLIFGIKLTGLFSHENNPEFLYTTGLYFGIVALTYAPGNLVTGWGSVFNAIGMPRRSFTMIIVRMLCLQLPLAFIGNHYFGVAGIFAAIAITNLSTGIVFHILNTRILRQHEGKTQ